MTSDIILLGHGSGGRLSHQLLDDLIVPTLSGIAPRDQNDAAVLQSGTCRFAFTTDSYVVDPIFFPGGNIGDLAVNGTVNDLAMCGARPLAISVGLILEEGLPTADLRRILEAMKIAAHQAGVAIATGDTKVVPRGSADKIFINTSGIGVFDHDLQIRGSGARPGDVVIINGSIGDHGMAVLASREGLELESDLQTDSTPLNGLVVDILQAGGSAVHALRDPTRGGVATTLKEIALPSEVTITLTETRLPVRPAVASSCAILGLDPLYVANEGKLLACVAPEEVAEVLAAMRRHPAGKHAAVIGEVRCGAPDQVLLHTATGGLLTIERLPSQQLPPICYT